MTPLAHRALTLSPFQFSGGGAYDAAPVSTCRPACRPALRARWRRAALGPSLERHSSVGSRGISTPSAWISYFNAVLTFPTDDIWIVVAHAHHPTPRFGKLTSDPQQLPQLSVSQSSVFSRSGRNNLAWGGLRAFSLKLFASLACHLHHSLWLLVNQRRFDQFAHSHQRRDRLVFDDFLRPVVCIAPPEATVMKAVIWDGPRPRCCIAR